MNGPSRFTPTSHGRDTLTFAAGRLGQAALRCALTRPEVGDAHLGWLTEVQSRRDRPWMAVEHEQGRFILHMRSIPHKFLYRLTHPDFDVLVSLGFDPGERRAIGLFVAAFRGDMEACSRFMLEMADWLEHPSTPAPTLAYEN